MNKIMCLILLLFASLITVSLLIDDNTSFLARISLFPFTSDYLISVVYLKLELRNYTPGGSYH